MNEHLQERFGRFKTGSRHRSNQAEVWFLPSKPNNRIRAYYEAQLPTGPSWLGHAAVPTSAEILDTPFEDSQSSDVVEIYPNKPEGAWTTKVEYLQTQYELLREDAVRPLREAVGQVKSNPSAAENQFDSKIGIYSRVHICAIIPSTKGVAVRVTFSLCRVGKKIAWEQSKRLCSQSLVALTPASDMFKTTAIIATIAARPLSGVQKNPPEIDLFVRSEELEIDPAIEWLMIEARNSLFEASKHTLVALQRMTSESFPLSEHLVDVQRTISVPQYVENRPQMDLTSIFPQSSPHLNATVDVLHCWPKHAHSSMDASQLSALRRILTRKLALIQGPPGTGKTWVSVAALKIMLQSRSDADGPIIVAAQTNHALDQLLRHVMEFEQSFIRLGGRCKDKEIRKRTLYEVKNETPERNLSRSLQCAKQQMNALTNQIKGVISPMLPSTETLNPRTLEQYQIITTAQADSLINGASRWVQDEKSGGMNGGSPIKLWLSDTLVPVPAKQQGEESYFEYEHVDDEIEELQELEAENVVKEDEEFNTLHGPEFPIADNYTCRKVPAGAPGKIRSLLNTSDLWAVPVSWRSALFVHFQSELKARIREQVRFQARAFDAQAVQRQIGQFETHEALLKSQKLIGMTTTGLSKYRGLISSLQPKIVLVEEAAETLEAPVAVACFPSLQHLILVGDHLQLRPHVQVKDHEDYPFYLNISLFERLVKNKLEYNTLAQQRRMRPEIRRLLYPIYKDLIIDHPSVLQNRPDVPGMGGINSFFFTHHWPETRDALMSCVNAREAEMIVGFIEYLTHNGVPMESITVITMYHGQRKRILSELRQRPALNHKQFKVVTVDAYQGEENEIVCLSLVRSNPQASIGFLDVANRTCVALSRAKNGFYLFGNGECLYRSKLWADVLKIIAGMKRTRERPQMVPRRLGEMLTVRCTRHDEDTQISEPEDWEQLVGGCKRICGELLACGHHCESPCHPFPHDNLECPKCPKYAAPAVKVVDRLPSNTSDLWKDYATAEPQRYAKAAAAATSAKARRKESVDLIDFGSEVDIVRETMGLSLRNASEQSSLLD